MVSPAWCFPVLTCAVRCSPPHAKPIILQHTNTKRGQMWLTEAQFVFNYRTLNSVLTSGSMFTCSGKAWRDRKTQRISIWKWETLRGRRRSIVYVFCDWIIVPSGFGKRDNPVKQADLWIFMTGLVDLRTKGGHSQDKIKDQSDCEDCRTGTWINQSQHSAEGHWGPDVWWVWLCFVWL